ncbi:MAG: hypothetical protein ACI8PB_002293 [Desulforhopalus sp.]
MRLIKILHILVVAILTIEFRGAALCGSATTISLRRNKGPKYILSLPEGRKLNLL